MDKDTNWLPFLIIVLAGFGWLMNFGKLFFHLDAPVTVLTIFRVVGVFHFWIAGVVGWL